MAKLELREINKSFGGEQALQDVSFQCRDGEFFCLLGPSGAGKTTTINIISGIEQPDQGEVMLDGEVINDWFPQDRNIATAFENYALYPHFTVSENLEFPLRAPVRANQYTNEKREARVREVADMLGIGELLGRYPKELSGGQRQRVALGRTLVRKPVIYLLDEPIAHLDAKLRHRMRGELKRIQMELGITTIYSTPDQLEALSMADTIAVLNEGKIEQIGDRREIYDHPANLFVAQFIGDPPMNIVDSRLEGDRLSGLFDVPLDSPASKQKAASAARGNLKLGFRPKDVRLGEANGEGSHASGQVKLIETFGRTSVLTIDVGTVPVKATVISDEAPEIGSNVGLALDPEKLFFFNADTTLRI